jgi:hypothetical protein
MIFPDWLTVHGDTTFRGACPKEHVEQASFFSRLRREYAESWGLIALHPRNEGLLQKGQFQAVIKHQIEGMAKGAADIVIPGGRGGFVCELKRRDHTQCQWKEGQREYLKACQDAGATVSVALGAAAAWGAFSAWASSG